LKVFAAWREEEEEEMRGGARSEQIDNKVELLQL